MKKLKKSCQFAGVHEPIPFEYFGLQIRGLAVEVEGWSP